ncbi:hypothetical protein [Gaetbulibacter saemankumensis]|uniref:hypothetical protein n=1 Tax=Gaetbulibacter saemankumensis TaxID=311208 RepID=UPI0003F980A2|nr:hypothetical protein [Gaetbulibacter saemankumensis]
MKSRFLLLFTVTLLFSSCSIDGNTPDRIIGNWQIIEYYDNSVRGKEYFEVD